MLCCPSCESRFFKTLEVRFELLKYKVQALIYKKRCKRCKQTWFIELTADNGKAKQGFVQYHRWQNAKRANQQSFLGKCTEKRPFVSDYTLLISSNTSKIFDKLLHQR